MSSRKSAPVVSLIFVDLDLVNFFLDQVDHYDAVSVKHKDHWIEYHIEIECWLHVEADVCLVDGAAAQVAVEMLLVELVGSSKHILVIESIILQIESVYMLRCLDIDNVNLTVYS